MFTWGCIFDVLFVSKKKETIINYVNSKRTFEDSIKCMDERIAIITDIEHKKAELEKRKIEFDYVKRISIELLNIEFIEYLPLKQQLSLTIKKDTFLSIIKSIEDSIKNEQDYKLKLLNCY